MCNKVIFILFIVVLLPFSTCIKAQDINSFEEFNARRQERFDKFREQKRKEFEEFRHKRNEEFAKFIRKDWKPVEPSPVIPHPEDESIPPVVIPKGDIQPIHPIPLPYDEIVPVPIPMPQPEPIEPIEEILVTLVSPPVPKQAFTFLGTSESVRFDKKGSIQLRSLNENSIADAWLKLSEESYTNLIHDCLKIRKERNLCDWAYLLMLEQMAESIYGKGTNESVMLMAYVYCQSGYKMRLSTDGVKLYMMFASDHIIYNWNYYTLDGENYYVFNNKTGNVRVCNQQYPKEQSMSLTIPKEQKLNFVAAKGFVHKSKRNPEIDITVDANKNMLDFYFSYPTSMIGENFVTRWAMYANMPMPKYVKEQIYPPLRQAIHGLDQLTAVNRILNWIQTGFEYEYDDKIWGQDRAFFPEESLYYPYCDCEDRSILMTRLLRDLLNLECILVYYPGHLSCAVRFTENVEGDYIDVEGKRFVIADPTYIGAPVGLSMPNMNKTEAKVILLK